MDTSFDILTPPQTLALAYATGESRAFLELMLAYDSRLAAIISNAKEPLIGQMRIEWWRDVIGKPAAERPTGEPLLAKLGTLEASIIKQAELSMLQLSDGWGVLLAAEIWTAGVLDEHANSRADAVFVSFAAVTMRGRYEIETVRTAGRYWAIATLFEYCQTEAHFDAVSAQLAAMQPVYRMPRALRPLSVLAFAALQNQQSRASNTQNGPRHGLRLIFNALTGR